MRSSFIELNEVFGDEHVIGTHYILCDIEVTGKRKK